MQAPSPPLPPPCAMEALDLHQEDAPHGCPGLSPNPNFICITAKSPKASAQFVLPQETPIRQFKEELSKHFQCETRQLVLVFFGRLLKDQHTLRQCGISDGMTVHLVIRSLERDPEVSAPTGTSLALPAVSPSSLGSWGPLERNPSGTEWHQMPSSEMVVQKVRQLILANPEIQQLAQQFPAICHILNHMGIMRVILDKMREIMDLAKNPDVEQELKNPELLLISVQSNTPGGDNPLRQLSSEVQEPNAGQDPVGVPSPYVTLARYPPCLEHTAKGGEGGGAPCSNSFPASNSYGRFFTNNSSDEEGGLSSSLPGPLGPPLPSLGPSPGAGPCNVGGIQALIVNLCNAYTQRMMLSLMQNTLLASGGSQMQRPEMVAAMSSPKAIQAWVQMEQGLQVLMEVAPVLIPWFVLRLKGLGPTSAMGAVAISSSLEGEPAATAGHFEERTLLACSWLRVGRVCGDTQAGFGTVVGCNFFYYQFCGYGLVGVVWWAWQGKDTATSPFLPLPTDLLSSSILLCRATKEDPADQLVLNGRQRKDGLAGPEELASSLNYSTFPLLALQNWSEPVESHLWFGS
uniref:Ubiquitin-like domain-containing protein n=1 Tax=Laticauda laticaudata TaxID=8630 RepID=A0A8C5RTT3_LATLA